MAPTGSPAYATLTDMGGCPSKWVAGSNIYMEGDKVSSEGLVFECRPFPYSLHCGQDGYEPISEGEAWKISWSMVGYCDGTIAPTSSPSFDPAIVSGCPDVWVASTYEADDLVSVVVQNSPEVQFMYKCRGWPHPRYCGQYSPIADGGDQGWEILGRCHGTISPTCSDSYSEECHFTFSLIEGTFLLPGHSQPVSEIGSGMPDVEFVPGLATHLLSGLSAHFRTHDVSAQILRAEITDISDAVVTFNVHIDHLSTVPVETFERAISQALIADSSLSPFVGLPGAAMNDYIRTLPSTSGRALQQNCNNNYPCSVIGYDCLPP